MRFMFFSYHTIPGVPKVYVFGEVFSQNLEFFYFTEETKINFGSVDHMLQQ